MPNTSRVSAFRRKKKEDEKNLKKKFPSISETKKKIKSRDDAIDEALRKAGLSEAEIRRLRGTPAKEKSKEKEKK